METPAILFLLVNYFNDEDVISFVRQQLEKQTFGNWFVVVTDNGSKNPESLKNELEQNPQVNYVKSHANLGYFNGAARGLETYLLEQGSLPEWIIVANADVKFLNTDFLMTLMNTDKNFDLLGPSIVSSRTRSDLNPFATVRMYKGKLKFLYYLFSIYPGYVVYQVLSLLKNTIFKREKSQPIPSSQNHLTSASEVYAIHGSFMVFGKSFFEKGGKIQYPSFLYEEEIYVAEQSRKLKLKTIYHPSMKLIHREHSTTGTIKSPQQIRLMRDSLQFILKTFYND